MNGFVDYLSSIEFLPEREREMIASRLKAVKLKRGSHFIESGQVCHHIGFVVEGVLRQYNYDAEGNECSLCFVKENSFVTDIQSFHARTAATCFIVAETDCEVSVFGKEDFDLFTREIPRWESIIHQVIELVLIEKAKEKSLIISNDATTRYLNFAEKHPDILLRVPLVSIASYLGVTKHSLSRIRKNLKQT